MVVIFDTEGDFRPEIIQLICERESISFEETLTKIIYFKSFDCETFKQNLEKIFLLKQLTRISLIAVDSLIAPFRRDFSKSDFVNRQYEIEGVMSTLRKFLDEETICIITNQITVHFNNNETNQLNLHFAI